MRGDPEDVAFFEKLIESHLPVRVLDMRAVVA